MNIKNYTSSVPVERSISLIERELVKAGASHIAKWYDKDGNTEGIMFQIQSNGIPLSFKLPAKWKNCVATFKKDIRKPRKGTEERVVEQAQRTAWKILFDWVQIQVSMIQLDQAEVAEVFMPYIWISGEDQTLFEKVRGGGFKMLGDGK